VAFEDLTGSSGFTSDSDGANANLDITMSEDSARNLWDVQAAIQQIATDFQTAVRAASDFQSYLISIRETGQTIQMPDLGIGGGEGGNMSYSGRVDTSTQPTSSGENNMIGRIAEMEENSTGDGGGAMAARAEAGGGGGGGKRISGGEVMNSLTQAAWLANSRGDRQAQAEQSMENNQQFQSAFDFAVNNPNHPMVTKAAPIGRAAAGTPYAFAAQQMVAAGLPAAQQFLRGGGLGGAARIVGGLGTVGAIGYAGYQLYQAGAEFYAQGRAMSIATNNSEHGLGWGMGQRLDTAISSLSPFYSSDDINEMKSTIINQGWASGGNMGQGTYGEALDFMKTNMRDYGMSPALSGQLLQSNALGAGASIESLNLQLATLKDSLDGTGVSMAAATSTFVSFTSFLTASGVAPDQAAVIAGGGLNAFAGNTYLGNSGKGAMSFMEIMASPSAQAIVGARTGHLPGTASYAADPKGSVAELEGQIYQMAKRIDSMKSLAPEDRVEMFRRTVNATFKLQWDYKTAEQFMYQAIAGGQHFYSEGMGKIEEEGTFKEADRSGPRAAMQGIDALPGKALTAIGLSSREENAGYINSYRHYSPQVESILNDAEKAGKLGEVTLYGPDGKPIQMDGKNVSGAEIARWFADKNNAAKFKDTKSGIYIQDQTGNQYNSQNIGLGGKNGVSGNTGELKGTVYITLSADAKKYFDTNTDKIEMSNGQN